MFLSVFGFEGGTTTSSLNLPELHHLSKEDVLGKPRKDGVTRPKITKNELIERQKKREVVGFWILLNPKHKN